MAEVLKLSGLDGVLATLKSLPPEVVSKRGGPVKSALRKAAVVIYKQADANLARVTANQSEEGARTSTGFLQKNLVVTRGKAPSSGKGERYLVRVRRKGYEREGQAVSTLKTAQLLEYGSSIQPAEPWLRPAFASKAEQAIKTAETELVNGINRVVKKLAAANKGK
jgi:HK97 gp10 family phage protein